MITNLFLHLLIFITTNVTLDYNHIIYIVGYTFLRSKIFFSTTIAKIEDQTSDLKERIEVIVNYHYAELVLVNLKLLLRSVTLFSHDE